MADTQCMRVRGGAPFELQSEHDTPNIHDTREGNVR